MNPTNLSTALIVVGIVVICVGAYILLGYGALIAAFGGVLILAGVLVNE